RGIVKVNVLFDDLLETGRSGFDAEEDGLAPGAGHHRDHFLIDAVGSGAAVPVEFFAGGDHRLAECDHPLPVHGKHVVDQIECGDAIDVADQPHLLDDFCGRFQPEIAAKEVVGRTEGACEGTAAPKFKGNVVTVLQLRIEVEGWKRDTVEIGDDGGVRGPNDGAAVAVGNAA